MNNDIQIMKSVGISGLQQSDGQINEEWHPKLKGDFGPKIYREMSDNSSAIGAFLYLIESLVKQVEWRVEPADSRDKNSQEWAAFVQECLEDMDVPLSVKMDEILSMLVYGWAYFEIVYKLRQGDQKDDRLSSKFADGKIGWGKFALRAQDTLERWQFSSEDGRGELLGMHQVDHSSGSEAFVPFAKSILFRTKLYKDNPEGRSLLRNAVVDYWFLKGIQEIEAIGIERDLAGLPVLEVPSRIMNPSASGTERTLRTELAQMMARIKRDEQSYIMLPAEREFNQQLQTEVSTGYRFRLLSSGGSRQIDTVAVKAGYRNNILQSVLAQFLQLGMDSVGSFALASSQTNIFSTALGSLMDNIADTITKHAVGPLMLINSVPSQYWPYLVHGDVETPPLGEIGTYVQQLAAAGQLPVDDPALQRKLLEYAGLPLPEEDHMV